MNRRELTFRVFVSSTFSDLKAERDALQKDIFPRLRDYCHKHGCQFQAIDLRWGVSEEAAADQSTMRICRAEIARCQAVTPRPNFVVLLGDRHGWRPLPDEIPAAEFEALLPHLPAELVNRWYKLDENIVCPRPDGTGPDKGVYVLQARAGAGNWADEVEGPLGDAFRRAARAVGLPETVRRKYEASATHQEIYAGAFDKPDAAEQVVAFIREMRTADGQPLPEALPPDAALKEFVDLKQGELDRESQEQLVALKRKLRDDLGPKRVKTYPAWWEGHGASTAHVPQLCADVYRALRRLIHAQIQRDRALPALDEERLRHREYAQRRARDFTGQAEPLAAIQRYLSPASEAPVPLVVHGVSGSGKSALLARVVTNAECGLGNEERTASESRNTSSGANPQSAIRNPKCELVYRFIGATANSTDPRSLLEGLCRELGERYPTDNTDLAVDLNKLIVIFRQRLALATAEHPLALVLDALDQLQGADRPELSWLPDQLPPQVRLVVSVVEVDSPQPAVTSLQNDCLTMLRKRFPTASFLPLQPMRSDEATELFQKWLAGANHRLASAEQRQAIREAIGRCSLPLYLRLAFEEAQRWRSYDPRPTLSPDMDGLIERMFRHLSEQLHHDEMLVERAVSFLRCSRYGLTEDEMLDLLARDNKYWERFLTSAHHALPITDGQDIRQLPIVIWSRLYHDLEPYLSWRSADGTALMVFFHTRFNEVADRQFLSADTVRCARHDALATYFLKEADPDRNQSWRSQGPRPLLHVTFHLAGAGKTRLDALCQTLCDLRFVEARCRFSQVFELIADYQLALEHLPEAQAELEEEKRRQERTAKWTREIIEYARQWSDRRDRLARGGTVDDPEPALPEIIPSVEPRSNERIESECQRFISQSGRLDRVSAFSEFVESEVYPLLEHGRGLGFVVQHAFNAVPAGPVHDTAAHFAMNLPAALLLRRWPANTAYNPRPALLRTLEGHTGAVYGLAVTSDSRFAVSGALLDERPAVWNLENGACLLRLTGHDEGVHSVSMTPDGQCAVSGSNDKTIRVWNLKTGICLDVLAGHLKWVRSISVTPDGRRVVSASGDKTVRVWDLSANCTFVRILEGHTGAVYCVAVTADGRRAISGGADKTLRVWDLDQGECVQILASHSDAVHSVSVAADGRRAVSGSGDKTVRVWDVENQRCLRVLEGHHREVYSVMITPDGRHAISGSADKTLRVWDLDKGECLRVLAGHTDAVHSVGVAADGRRTISGSGDQTVKMWDVESRVCVKPVEAHRLAVNSVSVTPDGLRVVSASSDKTLRIWNLQSGACLGLLEGHHEWVTSVMVTPDGRHAVSASGDHGIRVWDLENRTCLRTLEGHTSPVDCLMVTTDGRGVVSGSSDKTVRVWDMQSGTCEHILEGHRFGIRCVSMTSDGRCVVSGSVDQTLRIWDVKTGACLRTLEGHSWGVNSVSVTPDDRCAVTGGEDKTLRVWDLKTGACLRILNGHREGITSLCLIPNGRHAVSASRDRTVRVWDLESGLCLAVVTGSGLGNAVSYSSALNMVVAGTETGEVFCFHLAGLCVARPIQLRGES